MPESDWRIPCGTGPESSQNPAVFKWSGCAISHTRYIAKRPRPLRPEVGLPFAGHRQNRKEAVETRIADDAMGGEPLSAHVKRILVDKIIRGELVPGQRIVESRLAKELNISQSPVREALRDLVGLGLVEIEARRGARVRQPTPKELRDVSEVRAEIDALAARLAAENLDEDLIHELEQCHLTMSECHKSKDFIGMTEADARFHELIAHASGNGAVRRVFAQLEPFARTFITLTSPDVKLDGILNQHEGILEALVSGDGELAACRAHEHQLSVRKAFFEEGAIAEIQRNAS